MIKKPKVDELSPTTLAPGIVTVDEALWLFSRHYHEMLVVDHPSVTPCESFFVVMLAFEKTGFAARFEDKEGNITWKGTTKFFQEAKIKPGPIVTLNSRFFAQHSVPN